MDDPMTTNPNPSPTPTSIVPPNLDDDNTVALLADDNTVALLADDNTVALLDLLADDNTVALLDLLADDNTVGVLADLVASFDRGDELVTQLARDMAEADAALSGGTS